MSDDLKTTLNNEATISLTPRTAVLPWYLELSIAVCLFASLIIWAGWPVFSASNHSLPFTTDGLGHLTRVQYISECFHQGIWPSWFPYWYNGSTVMQYYPPLSFLLLAMIQFSSHNIMITYKCGVFLSLFLGGIGIWYFCYRLIGPWWGILGGILYALQPYFLRSLLCGGEIAQIPIFALTPWLLYCSFSFLEKRTPLKWLAILIIGGLLILSQPMHAFLICICIGITMLVMVLMRKISLMDCFYLILAIGMGAAIGAFWSVPGVTQLENPGVPYLLPEASSMYAATEYFFNPISRNSGGFYVSLAMIAFACCSILVIKKNKYIAPLLITMIISIVMSLGDKIPLYNYIPMHQSFVPRRFLSISVMAAGILCVLLVKELGIRCKKSRMLFKIPCLLLIAVIIGVIAVDIDPRLMMTKTDYYSDLRNGLNTVSVSKNPFDQGRFIWMCQVPSHMAYLPMIFGLNMSDGWSIEGTPHNREIWQHNIAIPAKCYDYVVKNILIWNARSVFIDSKYKGVIQGLQKNGFHIVDNNDPTSILLFNPLPSSYFMLQQRDALVIGKAARTLEMNFPWMVKGYSDCLEDYPAEYFKHFKLIYIIEPEVKDFERFEARLAELAAQDKVVIISQGRGEAWPILDIIPYWEVIETPADLTPSADSPLKGKARIEADPTGRAPAIGNADILWAITQESDKKIPAIGYKTVNGHRVYFVGLALGQQMNGRHGREIKNILEQLLDMSHPNKSIVPVAFPVDNTKWRYDGFSFNYNAGEKEALPMQISVTYSPRWKATVDGRPWRGYNMENLIYMDLPPGQHEVSFQYGMTWVGWLGIALSVFSLIILVLIYKFFDIFEVIWQELKTKSVKLITELGQ